MGVALPLWVSTQALTDWEQTPLDLMWLDNLQVCWSLPSQLCSLTSSDGELGELRRMVKPRSQQVLAVAALEPHVELQTEHGCYI